MIEHATITTKNTKINLLKENTLYTTPFEKVELLKNKQLVADAFFINFLGILGLFSISDTRSKIKTYFQDDGQLQIQNIADENKDISLSVKLYHEIGGLRPDVVNKITRLLLKIKSRAITIKNFDESAVREIISNIQIQAHRPHPFVLTIVKKFLEGATLAQVAKAFFLLIRARKDFKPVTREFFDLAKQYIVYFKDIPDIGVTFDTDPSTSNISSPAAQHLTYHLTQQTQDQDQKQTQTAQLAQQQTKSLEDLYLLLWKATSKAEIKKLQTQFNFELTQEFLKNAINYLVPSTEDKKAHLDMVLSVMPDYPVFKKALGAYLRVNKKLVKIASIAYLYKIAHQQNVQNIINLLLKLDNQDILNYSSIERIEVGGYTATELKDKIFSKIATHFQKRIIQADLNDDIHALFSEFIKEFDALVNDLFREPILADHLYTFAEDSAFSIQDKIKYYIAYLSSVKMSQLIVVERLFDLVQRVKGIEYDYDRGYHIISFERYDNLFKNSKQLIDKWYTNVESEYIRFRKISDLYAETARFWNDPDALLREIGRNEYRFSVPAFIAVHKLSYEIEKAAGKENEQFLLDNYALNYRFPARAYDSELVKLLHLSFVEKFIKKIQNNEFWVSESSVLVYALLFFEHASNDFTKPADISYENWNAYLDLLSLIGKKSKEFQNIVIKKILEKSGVRINLFSVLSRLDADFNSVIRYILDNKLYKKGYNVIIDLLTDRVFTPYLTDLDYRDLGAAITYKTDFFDYFLFLKKHDKNIFDYLPYNTILKFTQLIIFDEIRKGFFEETVIETLFNGLKAADQFALVRDVKAKIFDKNTENKGYYLHMLLMLQDDEKLKKYIMSLSTDQQSTVFTHFTIHYIRLMPPDVLNQTVQKVLNNRSMLSELQSKIIIDYFEGYEDKLDLDTVKQIVQYHAKYDRNQAPSVRREFEHAYFRTIKLLYQKDKQAADEYFLTMPLDEREQLVKYLKRDDFLKQALQQIMADNLPIKPLHKPSPLRLEEILKFNNIGLYGNIDLVKNDQIKLSDILEDKIESFLPQITDLHVKEVPLSAEELEQLSIEFDKYNHYKHGHIAMKFLRVFDVDIPAQKRGFALWLKKMKQEEISTKVLKPVFHGTGSIGASMILRYGFRVLSTSDPYITGRMLGDGIYFSNVLDKVAQYIGDDGYTRSIGTKGYIFEMEANLGKHERDYRCAGTGTAQDSYHDVISPEWVVYHPNQQLKIYRAYFVEIITNEKMREMKAKYGQLTESTATSKMKSFQEYLASLIAKRPHCITYIFMDGTIPIARDQVIDFEKFKPEKYGKHVKFDITGSGPAVKIYNTKETKTYIVRYTREFMENRDGEFDRYLKLLKTQKA